MRSSRDDHTKRQSPTKSHGLFGVISTLLLLSIVFCFSSIAFAQAHSHEVSSHTCASLEAACTGVIEHVTHWQLVSMAVVVKAAILVVLALAFITHLPRFLSWLTASVSRRREQRPQIPSRFQSSPPSLFQELFSSGILHSKAF